MKTVTTDEFGLHTADYLRDALDGETVQIVEPGRPVLELKVVSDHKTTGQSPEEIEAIWQEILARRDALPKVVTLEELMEWRREGMRY